MEKIKNGNKLDTFSLILKVSEKTLANLDTPTTRYGRSKEPMAAEAFLFEF